MPTPPRYIRPTQESGRAFVNRQTEGAIVMLNLLRFREFANYQRALS